MKEKIIKILTELRPEFDFTDVVNLVTDLDSTFGISIDGVDILPENFSSVESIEKLLIKNGAK